jgi:hypothetical protein
MRSAFRFRLWPVVLVALVLLFIGATAYDYATRYLSWANLSKAELVESARWYVRERAPGQKACLYAVTCDKGRARLALVKNVSAWDIEGARQITWDRRFGDFCPGQTANFALEVAEGGPTPPLGGERATWSFHLDRFRPWQGHSYSAFSEKPAEPCTVEHAVAG